MNLLPLLLLLAAASSAWQFRRPLTGPAAPITQITLDPHVLAHSNPGLSDIRILLQNRELPYALRTAPAPPVRPAIPLDRALGKDGLQITLDAGPNSRHNAVRLSTPLHNFRAQVFIHASDDRRNWNLLRDDAAIFDFTQDGATYRLLDLPYPTSTRRYLRLTIPAWTSQDALSSADLTFLATQSPKRTLLTQAEPQTEPDGRQTHFIFDLTEPGFPVDQIAVSAGDAAFARTVRVEASADRRTWTPLTVSTIARYPGGETLALSFFETRRRYFRLTVYNGDDAPLRIRSAAFSTQERTLLLEGFQPGAELYYGNPKAQSPEYDLALRLPTTDPTPLTLAAVQINPDYQPPIPPQAPWTDRHPVLLWAILLSSIAALGALLWRLLQSLPPSPTH
ncbi:MAG: DUF3999 family protein [Acidobacteria bacterium]|nr:DUF3999 family protein [Acidobacteriota bacterium]